MSAGGKGRAPRPEEYRAYLMVVVRLFWDRRLQGRLDPADIVQQTLLEAHRDLHQYRGKSDEEFQSWLRQCLWHNLADAAKKMMVPGTNMLREAQILDALEESSSRFERLIAAEQSSPSELAVKDEQLLLMAAALERLPEAQREAVMLHKHQEMSLADVARQMGRTVAAVAGLYRRGIKKLRDDLGGPE